MKFKFLIIILFLILLFPYQTKADITFSEFNPNKILSDDDIFNINSLTYQELDLFLKTKGKLGWLKLKDIDGQLKSPADIIWRISHSYKINPQYLLALLQKEQSLIENPSPTQKQLDWATGYAVCDSCSLNNPKIQNYKGFANQLEWAAKQHREKYFIQLLTHGYTISGKGVGMPLLIDGQVIIPSNKATAMLYSYTPHIHGNKMLWKIWQRWFFTPYPNGTIAQDNQTQETFLISYNKKRKFKNKNVLLATIDPNKIIIAKHDLLTHYSNGPEIKFPPYSLLKTENNNLYLTTKLGKRKFENKETFYKLGFIEDEIINVKESEIKDIPNIKPITKDTEFPQGILAKDTKTNKIWYIQDNQKQIILNSIFLKLYFPDRPIINFPHQKILQYKTTKPYHFHNNELVKATTNNSVYLVVDNELHPIPSAEVFESFHWKWQNIINVDPTLLKKYSISTSIKKIPNFTNLIHTAKNP